LASNGRSNFTVRAGGHIADNTSLEGGVGFTLGSSATGGSGGNGTKYSPVNAEYNVLYGNRDEWKTQSDGDTSCAYANVLHWGWGIEMGFLDNGNIHHNLIAHATRGRFPLGLRLADGIHGVELANNVVYDWALNGAQDSTGLWLDAPGGTLDHAGTINVRLNDIQQPFRGKCMVDEIPSVPLSSNRFYCPQYSSSWRGGSYTQVSYPDPGRTTGRYNAEVLGGANSDEAFVSNLLTQSRSSWNSLKTAREFNRYMRAGFNMPNP